MSNDDKITLYLSDQSLVNKTIYTQISELCKCRTAVCYYYFCFSFAHTFIFVCCSLFQIVVCTTPPLHDLRHPIRLRLPEDGVVVGFDLANQVRFFFSFFVLSMSDDEKIT
jgi:hypothetical protein